MGELRRAFAKWVLINLMEIDERIGLPYLDVARQDGWIAVRHGDRILILAETPAPRQHPEQAEGRVLTSREAYQLVFGTLWWKEHHLHRKSLRTLADGRWGRAWYQARYTRTGLPARTPPPLEKETNHERAQRLNQTAQLVDAAIQYIETVLGVAPSWARRRPRRHRP